MGFSTVFNAVRRAFIVAIFFMMLFSCKTDEFRFADLEVKEDFGLGVMFPLLNGKMEFSDLAHANSDFQIGDNERITVLSYRNGDYYALPTRLIFQREPIFDSIPILLQGHYDLSYIEMEFKVSNGAPLPLKLEVQFFRKTDPDGSGPPIVPPAFPAAVAQGENFVPQDTILTVRLDEQQRQSFLNCERAKMLSWFEYAAFIDAHDTVWAHYPINISISLKGEVKIINEE